MTEDIWSPVMAEIHSVKTTRLSNRQPSPFISPYHCTTARFCEALCRAHSAVASGDARGCGIFPAAGAAKNWSRWAWDDAAFVARCDDGYQRGEARGFAAAARRTAASPQAVAAGHADAIATLMRRTLMGMRAPILSSLRRMVPQVALAYSVSCSPMRRKAHSST